MQVTEAIILAGGAGTRLRSRVSEVPKPMAPVGERPFLELVLDYWISQGIKRFTLSLGHLASKIELHFGSSYRGAQLAYSVEERPLDTGGGLLLASRRLETPGPFIALNGDTLFTVELAALDRDFFSRNDPRTVTMALTRREGARFSTVSLAGSRVTGISQGQAAGLSRLVNGGVYVFGRVDLLSLLGHRAGDRFSLETDLLPELARSGRLFGLEHAGRFADIGTPGDYDSFRTEQLTVHA